MDSIVIETQRLILRPVTPDDAEAVFKWTSDSEVTKYMAYSTHTDVEFTRTWLERLTGDIPDRYFFGFVRKADGELIGTGAISPIQQPEKMLTADGTPERIWGFGYNIRRDYWGQGYATEAVKRIIGYINASCGGTDFSTDHAVDNIASGKVLEKCGLHFDHFSSYKKIDGSAEFAARVMYMHVERGEYKYE